MPDEAQSAGGSPHIQSPQTASAFTSWDPYSDPTLHFHLQSFKKKSYLWKPSVMYQGLGDRAIKDTT